MTMNPNGARAPKETLDLRVPSLFVEFRIVTSLTRTSRVGTAAADELIE
jgi:hypothetical protein